MRTILTYRCKQSLHIDSIHQHRQSITGILASAACMNGHVFSNIADGLCSPENNKLSKGLYSLSVPCRL